jgi:uncharacterized protein (DUF1499 family)
MPTIETKSNFAMGRVWFLPILLLLIVLIWLGIRIALPNTPTIFAGTRPSNLGIQSGMLASCPPTPNCVSSQSQYLEHYIKPLTYSGNPQQAFANLKQIIQDRERANLIGDTDNYIYAEFTSKWMGFVDDVEFYLNENAGEIDIRSASRLGESDLGVNRQRIEKIRNQFNRSIS